MADKFKENWCDALPWVLLSRHAAYQPDLGASPAELVLGTCLKLPGDLIRDGDPPVDGIADLVDAMRLNAARPPVQTSHHRTVPTHWPKKADSATHVYLKKGKVTPLGANFEGPFRIIDKIGDSCLKVKTGLYTSGAPTIVTAHWNNCKVADMAEDAKEATRKGPGRPKKNIIAPA